MSKLTVAEIVTEIHGLHVGVESCVAAVAHDRAEDGVTITTSRVQALSWLIADLFEIRGQQASRLDIVTAIEEVGR